MSEPTTLSGRALFDDYAPRCARFGTAHTHNGGCPSQPAVWPVAIEAEARALLLDELEAAVRGMLRTDVDDVSVLALIQQHREAIR